MGAWLQEPRPLSLVLSRGSGLHGGDCGKARALETLLPPAQPETSADTGGCPRALHSLDESEKSRECVCVCTRAGRAGGAVREGAAEGPAAAEPAPSSIVCDPPAAAAQQRRFCSVSGPPARRPTRSGLARPSPRALAGGGPGSARGAGGEAGAPLPPGTPLAGRRAAPGGARQPGGHACRPRAVAGPAGSEPGWAGGRGAAREPEVAGSLALLARCPSICSRAASPIPFR